MGGIFPVLLLCSLSLFSLSSTPSPNDPSLATTRLEMSRQAPSNNTVDPSLARMTEDAVKQKAVGSHEKRELVGDDEYKHATASITNKNALLENPLQVRRSLAAATASSVRR